MYHLENRHQDGGWQSIPDEIYVGFDAANLRARELARDAICYGMVRVIDGRGQPVVTYPAGGGKPERHVRYVPDDQAPPIVAKIREWDEETRRAFDVFDTHGPPDDPLGGKADLGGPDDSLAGDGPAGKPRPGLWERLRLAARIVMGEV